MMACTEEQERLARQVVSRQPLQQLRGPASERRSAVTLSIRTEPSPGSALDQAGSCVSVAAGRRRTVPARRVTVRSH
jgi:hypothetical protein